MHLYKLYDSSYAYAVVFSVTDNYTLPKEDMILSKH